MFRYIALCWDIRSDSASAAAARLIAAAARDTSWRVAHAAPGLHLLTAGERAGINEVHVLADPRGLILGRIFSLDAQPLAPDHFARHPELTADILRTAGRHLTERYWGRYVAILPALRGGFHLIRDPGGSLPCFRVRHGDVDIAFSWLEGLLECLPAVPLPDVDGPSLAAYLAFGELTGRLTALQGVAQTLPGERVPLGGAEDPPCLLWSLSERAGAGPVEDIATARDTLRQTVRRCARSWADCYPSIVLRLSGGLDSSILASCLADDQTRARVTCVNYHSPGADSDERQFARLAAARARRRLVERERNLDFPLAQILDLALTPRPAAYTGRFGSRQDIELARATGASAQFTGAGGDQLFFEFQRWWPAADYLRNRGIDRGLPMALMNAARLGKVSVWRATRLAAADLLRRGMPPPLTDRPLTLATEALWLPLRHPERFAHPAACKPAGLPIGKLMQVLQLAHVGGYYDPWHRDAAPELVHPLMSQPLVELCLRIPTYVLTLGGRARGLARAAFEEDLPPAIARRRSKGGLQEFLHAILERNLDFARQLLLDGELARRGLIDRRRTELALSRRDDAGRVRPGEVHLLIAVEAWLLRHGTLRSVHP